MINYTVQSLYESLVKQGLTRSDNRCSLGGGVVGPGWLFSLSTYMGYSHFVQIPKFDSFQVDSYRCGKTGVNTTFANNSGDICAQPYGVLIDPCVLDPLGKRELIEGMGEVFKYGLIEYRTLWALVTGLNVSVEYFLEHADLD